MKAFPWSRLKAAALPSSGLPRRTLVEGHGYDVQLLRLLSLFSSIMSAMPDSLSVGSKKTENTFSRLKRKRNEKKLLIEEILSISNCARASDKRNN